MTFLGKILVVLQVVLSVCFMLFAGAVFSVQQNWKSRTEKAQAQLATTQKNFSDLNSKFEAFQTQKTGELKQAQDTAQKFEAQSTALNSQLETVKQELETARTERDNQRALAQIAGDEARARRDEAAVQHEENRQLQQTLDNLIVRARTLEDNVFTKDIAAKQMNEKQISLLNDLAVLKSVIRQNHLDDNPKAYIGKSEPPPAGLRGRVSDYKKGKGTADDFVEIDLGSDDGLLVGHELLIYRDSATKYLGKIRIVYVEPDRAVGVVIDKAKNGIIGKNDDVTSSL